MKLVGNTAFCPTVTCPKCGGKMVTGFIARTRCCNMPYTTAYCTTENCNHFEDGEPSRYYDEKTNDEVCDYCMEESKLESEDE